MVEWRYYVIGRVKGPGAMSGILSGHYFDERTYPRFGPFATRELAEAYLATRREHFRGSPRRFSGWVVEEFDCGHGFHEITDEL